MDRGYISIGEFLQSTIKLQPSIELRYKGLGELDSEGFMANSNEPRINIDSINS